jgi:hypothetical protein
MERGGRENGVNLQGLQNFTNSFFKIKKKKKKKKKKKEKKRKRDAVRRISFFRKESTKQQAYISCLFENKKQKTKKQKKNQKNKKYILRTNHVSLFLFISFFLPLLHYKHIKFVIIHY